MHLLWLPDRPGSSKKQQVVAEYQAGGEGGEGDVDKDEDVDEDVVMRTVMSMMSVMFTGHSRQQTPCQGTSVISVTVRI